MTSPERPAVRPRPSDKPAILPDEPRPIAKDPDFTVRRRLAPGELMPAWGAAAVAGAVGFYLVKLFLERDVLPRTSLDRALNPPQPRRRPAPSAE